MFERNYSRALNDELEGTGITVTAVRPGWVDTEMLSREMNGKKPVQLWQSVRYIHHDNFYTRCKSCDTLVHVDDSYHNIHSSVIL